MKLSSCKVAPCVSYQIFLWLCVDYDQYKQTQHATYTFVQTGPSPVKEASKLESFTELSPQYKTSDTNE